MGLLNEIRLWNLIRQVICETFEYVWTVERDENVKRDQTIEFVTLFNMWDCWMRLDCGIG